MRIKGYDHPTDDGKLPSYVHPTLRRALPDIDRAWDCWQYLAGDIIENYLPQEPGEPPDAYKGRVGRAVYASFFREACEMFAGALARYQLKSPPKTFDDAQDDIDREGNDHRAFFLDADAKVLRDGGVLIVVDMPPEQARSRAEEMQQKRRPYLTIHPRAMVRNWRCSQVGGSEYVEGVTIMELVEVPDGEYGVKTEFHYRIIGPGSWKVVKIVQNQGGEPTVETVDEGGPYLNSKQQPLDYAPVVWYAPTPGKFGEGDLPLRQVMMHSIEHLQTRSDLAEKTHKCAMPVPVVIGRPKPGPGEPQASLVIGPNTVVDLEQGGSFSWEEPSAGSLAEQRAQLETIEDLIKSQTLAFIASGTSKTATQAGLEMAGTQASLTRMGKQKANVFQRIFQIWCDYTGEKLEPEAGIVMAQSLYDRPLTSQDVGVLQTLTGGEQLLSKRSAIEELHRGGVVMATVSVDEELQRIAAEEEESMQRAVESGLPVPGPDAMAEDVELPMSTDQGQVPDPLGGDDATAPE